MENHPEFLGTVYSFLYLYFVKLILDKSHSNIHHVSNLNPGTSFKKTSTEKVMYRVWGPLIYSMEKHSFYDFLSMPTSLRFEEELTMSAP